MIRDAEIRRRARVAGVEPRTMQLDYAFGWALRGIAGHPYLARRLVFKGGTCLRKCYFPDYRFSEDLDFTATQWFGWHEFEEAVTEAFAEVQKASGINFGARKPRLRVIDDEYGRERPQVDPRPAFASISLGPKCWRSWGPSGGDAPGRGGRGDRSPVEELDRVGPQPDRGLCLPHHFLPSSEKGEQG